MKKDYSKLIVISIIILAIAVIIGAVIISNSNKSSNTNDNQQINNPSPTETESANQNISSENNPETCKAAGTGCLYTQDCCGSMLCCRPKGYSSGYCAVSCA